MDLTQILNVSKGFSGVLEVILGILGAILASCIIIEVSPIKINPLKFLFEWISRGFKSWFADIIDDSLDKQMEGVKEENKKRDEAIVKMDGAIDNINEKIDQITSRMDANEARAQKNHISLLRNSVLSFANDIRAGADPSKESFDYIVSQIDEYNEFVNKYKIENNCMTLSETLILEQYKIRFNTIKKDDKNAVQNSLQGETNGI